MPGKKALAIIGPIAPPVGGIAIHLERFLPFLDRAGIDFIVYNQAGPTNVPGRIISVCEHRRSWFLKFLLTCDEKAVYLIATRWQAWAGSWVLSAIRGKKVIIGLHGAGLAQAWEKHGWLVRKMIRAGLKRASQIIAVNEHVLDAVKRAGDFEHKTLVAPAFIPPSATEMNPESIPTQIAQYCQSHHPVLLGNGAPSFWKGVDLYGIDMAVDLVERLRKRYPQIGLVWFMLKTVGYDANYGKQLREKVRKCNLEEQFFFCDPIESFCSMFSIVDLFIRPTAMDGDAISLREALACGIPAVASDAIKRPEGVELHKTRNLNDLEAKVVGILSNLKEAKSKVHTFKQPCSAEAILERIQGIISGG